MARIYRSMSADLDKINPQVLSWLMTLDENYSILVEFSVENKNCDFSVLGPDLIAILEVKDYTFQLKGNANSRWFKLPQKIPLAISKSGAYPANPIGQATKIGEIFKDFVQRNSDGIFGRRSKRTKEWLKVFPFVVIPRPHPGNQLNNDADFCWIVQGRDNFFKGLYSKHIHLPEGFRFTPGQHDRIVQLLGLERELLPEKLLVSPSIIETPIHGDPPLQPEYRRPEELPEASLILKEPDQPAQEYALAEKVTLIGRHPECHIKVDFEKASRKHCQIEFLNGSFFLKDLSSKHGTYLNGYRISPGSYNLLGSKAVISLASEDAILEFNVSETCIESGKPIGEKSIV